MCHFDTLTGVKNNKINQFFEKCGSENYLDTTIFKYLGQNGK
jgi:hypothetical protein